MKNRSLVLDVARILAVMLVLLLHTAMDFVKFNPESSSYLCGSIFNAAGRAGVPMFIMISGALMLDEERQISVRDVFTKYILKLVMLFIAWSCIYALLYFVKAENVTAREILSQIIYGKYHMWYLVMMMGLYMTVPILKLFIKKDNSKIIGYMLILSIIFELIPTFFSALSSFSPVFSQVSRQMSRFGFNFLGIYAVYFVTGWYIVNVGIKNKKALYLLSVLSLAAMILLTQLIGNCKDTYSNENLMVYLYSVGVFVFINELCAGKTSIGMTEKLSRLTFGVYITHIIVRESMDCFVPVFDITVSSILIRYLALSVISFAVCFFLSQIPILKKLVRF